MNIFDMVISLSVLCGPDHRGLSPSPHIIIGRKKASWTEGQEEIGKRGEQQTKMSAQTAQADSTDARHRFRIRRD